MRRRYQSFLAGAAIFLALSSLLGGCLTLSEDVTPPPENSAFTSQPTAGVATQAPVETPQATLDTPDNQDDLTGLITVEVIDQTGGTLPLEELIVELEGYDQFELVFQNSQDLSSSFQVSFSDVPFQAGRVFFASIDYGGAVYRSEIIQASEDTSSLDLQIQVFETTTDTSGLIIDRLHLVIDFPGTDIIQISEIFILSNLGSATIVAESPGQSSVEFPLPEGAGSLAFEDGALGQRFLLTDSGFGDTVSIPPGQGVYQVVVSYLLPYERNRLDFVQRLNYPLSAHVVIVPAVGVKVRNSSLQDLGIQSLPDSEIQIYSGGAIAGGEVLEFRLTGNPTESSVGTLGDFSQWFMIGLALLGTGLLGSGIWLFIRSRKETSRNQRIEFSDLDRDEILDSIIALEDLFQAGEIAEAAYKSKRDQLKKQLKELTGNE